MWRKVKSFIHRENSVLFASGILILSTTLSNVLGLFRDHFLARNVSTYDLDIYYAAFRIPDLIFNILIFGAISAAFIPVFTSHVSNNEEKDAWHLTNSLISISVVVLVFLAVIGYIFMPLISPLIVPKFSAERLSLTIKLTRILMLTPIFFSVSYFLGGVLNSYKRFVAYSFAPLVYNLSIIFGAIFLAPKFGISGVVYSVVFGSFLHMLVQFPTAINLGFTPKVIFDLKMPSVLKVLKLMIPRAIGMGASNIMLVIYTAISSALAVGSIAVFNLANNIQTMPTVVFATSFSTAIFPTLAHKFSTGDHETFSSYISRSARVIFYLLAPSTVIFILLRAQIIRLILGSGKFGWQDTKMAALTLGWFSVSLIAQGLIPLFSKAFYAKHDTKTPTILSVISITVGVIVAYPLSKKMGVAGLAAAFSLGSYINLLLLFAFLNRSTKNIFNIETFLSLAKIVFSSFLMALAVRASAHYFYNLVDMQRFLGVLAQSFLATFVGVIVYLTITYLLNSEELNWATRRRVNDEKTKKN